MDSLVLALLMMHVDEFKKQMKEAIDTGEDTKVEAAYTAWKTLKGVMQNIQTQLAAIQQAQEDNTRAKNTQLNEGENPIETEGGNENDEG